MFELMSFFLHWTVRVCVCVCVCVLWPVCLTVYMRHVSLSASDCFTHYTNVHNRSKQNIDTTMAIMLTSKTWLLLETVCLVTPPDNSPSNATSVPAARCLCFACTGQTRPNITSLWIGVVSFEASRPRCACTAWFLECKWTQSIMVECKWTHCAFCLRSTTTGCCQNVCKALR